MRDAKSGGASDARAVQAVSGTFAVCLLLAGTKWASYLGSAPLFLTDTLLALAVFHHLASHQQAGAAPGALRRPFVGLGWVLALVAWAVFRFVGGVRADLDVLRDVAPYLYPVVAFLAASSVARSSVDSRRRTARFLWYA